MRLTATQIYDRLVYQDKILTLEGQIKFFLGNVNIVVRQRDVVGNIMQEWLEGWLKQNNVDYAPSTNTQMPPDFYLNPDDLTKDLLEVKAFNFDAGPAFDIASFSTFQREIIAEPYMLHVKYLVFGYRMSDDGIVTISNVWLKNVWELTRPMANWAINLQVKNNVVHKIRPGVFYSSSKNFNFFNSLEDFLSAIEETVYQDPATHNNAGAWRGNMIKAYNDFYGVTLNIPHWADIKSRYVL